MPSFSSRADRFSKRNSSSSRLDLALSGSRFAGLLRRDAVQLSASRPRLSSGRGLSFPTVRRSSSSRCSYFSRMSPRSRRRELFPRTAGRSGPRQLVGLFCRGGTDARPPRDPGKSVPSARIGRRNTPIRRVLWGHIFRFAIPAVKTIPRRRSVRGCSLSGAAFLLSWLAVPFFAAPLARLWPGSDDSRAGRFAFTCGAGAVLLTLVMLLLTSIGVRWSVAGISITLGFLS